jgi:glycosyltransferase involved in cell wall biosynthesis
MPPKICFISDKHHAQDDRIYWKLALSLRKAGFDVSHLCVGNKSQRFVNEHDVSIVQFDSGLIKGLSFFKKILKVFRFQKSYAFLKSAIVEQKAAIYIISDIDPLVLSSFIVDLPWKPVLIYDVHDPFYITIRDRYNGNIDRFFSFIYAYYTRFWELYQVDKCNAVVTTECNWEAYFRKHLKHKEIISIHNYPIFEVDSQFFLADKTYDLIYIGTLTDVRGVTSMLDLMVELNLLSSKKYSLLLVGAFADQKLKVETLARIQRENLKDFVFYMEEVAHHEVALYYSKARLGLILFQNTPSNQLILPIKLFEYMIFGLPIVGTSIGHIKTVINEVENGILVDPSLLPKTAIQIKELLDDSKRQEMMIQNGLNAVNDRFHWKYEAPKFVDFCKSLLLNNKNTTSL